MSGAALQWISGSAQGLPRQPCSGAASQVLVVKRVSGEGRAAWMRRSPAWKRVGSFATTRQTSTGPDRSGQRCPAMSSDALGRQLGKGGGRQAFRCKALARQPGRGTARQGSTLRGLRGNGEAAPALWAQRCRAEDSRVLKRQQCSALQVHALASLERDSIGSPGVVGPAEALRACVGLGKPWPPRLGRWGVQWLVCFWPPRCGASRVGALVRGVPSRGKAATGCKGPDCSVAPRRAMVAEALAALPWIAQAIRGKAGRGPVGPG